MNHDWLQRVQNNSMIGKAVIIMACGHVDVKAGQAGIITGLMPDGFAVETTGKFAIDIHGTNLVEKTETVFVEAKHVKLAEVESK